MAQRQATNGTAEGTGRAAQRRRTRAAIVAAATRLIAAGRTPSVDDVAAEADVSRRTVYMYFPTLDQLLLDATAGALTSTQIDDVLTKHAASGDAGERVDALVHSLLRLAPDTLPLGRKIVALTADRPGGARRGQRRLTWIEAAVEPLRDRLSTEQYERLVAALSIVIGWEAMIVLQDVHGMRPRREEQVLRWAAGALVQAMLAEAEPG